MICPCPFIHHDAHFPLQEVWGLLQELQALVTTYTVKYQAADAHEWRLVASEVNDFLHADIGMPVPRSPAEPLPFKLNLRCNPNSAEARVLPHQQVLAEAVLVSYYHKQVRPVVCLQFNAAFAMYLACDQSFAHDPRFQHALCWQSFAHD